MKFNIDTTIKGSTLCFFSGVLLPLVFVLCGGFNGATWTIGLAKFILVILSLPFLLIGIFLRIRENIKGY